MMAPIRNPAIAVLVDAIAAQSTAREMLQVSDLIAGAAGEKMADEVLAGEAEAEEARRANGEAS